MENNTSQLSPKKNSVSTLSAVIAIVAILTAIGAALISFLSFVMNNPSTTASLVFSSLSTEITCLIMMLVLPVCLFIAAFSEKSGFPRFLLAVTVLVFLVQAGAAILCFIVDLSYSSFRLDLWDFQILFQWIPGSTFLFYIHHFLQYFKLNSLIWTVSEGLYLLDVFLCVIASVFSALKKR